jgi:hypothetical protein
MKKIRIVYLITGLNAGGAETMLSRLVGRLGVTSLKGNFSTLRAFCG